MWALSFTLICHGYPDLSGDHTISEAELEPLYQDYVNKLREKNEDIPQTCHTSKPESSIFLHWLILFCWCQHIQKKLFMSFCI